MTAHNLELIGLVLAVRAIGVLIVATEDEETAQVSPVLAVTFIVAALICAGLASLLKT